MANSVEHMCIYELPSDEEIQMQEDIWKFTENYYWDKDGYKVITEWKEGTPEVVKIAAKDPKRCLIVLAK